MIYCLKYNKENNFTHGLMYLNVSEKQYIKKSDLKHN